MKKQFLYSVAAVAMLAFASPAMADAAPGNSIAVVNIQQIMHDSTAAKNVREQLDSKQKAFQADLSKKEEKFQKEEQELGKERSVLSKAAFDEKARAFSKKATEAQKDVESKKALLNNAFAHANYDLQKAVTDIVADIAKEKGFLIALPTESPTSQVLYADPKLDITQEVLTRLNKKLPKLDVKFEAPPEAAAAPDAPEAAAPDAKPEAPAAK